MQAERPENKTICCANQRRQLSGIIPDWEIEQKDIFAVAEVYGLALWEGNCFSNRRKLQFIRSLQAHTL